jgi:hypothetical protein
MFGQYFRAVIWYDNYIDIDDRSYHVQGTFDESMLRITIEGEVFYQKPINLWRHQEILAEDILQQYQGMVLKYEKKLPQLVKAGRFKPLI